MSQTCQEVKLFLKRIVKFSIQNILTLRSFSSLTDAGSTLVSEIQ